MTDKVIVFVTPQLKTGGGNRVFVELASVLAARCSVSIVCPNNSREKHTFEMNEAVKIVQIGDFAESNFNKIKNLFRTISYLNKNHQQSSVIISDPIMSIFGFLLNMRAKYRFIQADDYSIFDDRMIIKKKWMLNVYKFLTKVSYSYNLVPIFNSVYTREQYSKIKRIPKENLNLVHPAINNHIFQPALTTSVRPKLQLCLVARKHPWKGLHTFLDAWNTMPEEIKAAVGKVVFVSHDDLSSFNLDHIEVVNPKSDLEISRVMQESDIFISTSWWEGFGLPPLEAMACGCSVLTSDSGGVNEYAKDGENCIMFRPKDVGQLKEKLTLLIENEELRKRVTEQGKRDAKEFSWENSAEQLLRILKPEEL